MAELYVKHLPDGTKLQGGKYEIVRFINSGGFGCTYEAWFPMLRTRVAIKEFFMGKYCVRDQQTGWVSTATADSKEIVDKCRNKFVDEASTLYGMSHRSIVRVADIFEENGTAYFAMDFISGRTLSEIVRDEGPMPEQKAIDCMRQICEALDYLHASHRLHLDIKPDNIMIDDDGRAVLIDFGASKYLDNASVEEKRVTSNVVQTPGYSPNEQLTGDLSRFTNATDLYALGATLYYVLSGITPVSGTLRSAGEELEPLPDTISESTRQAVDKAMRLMKSDRPQTAKEFSALLKDVPPQPRIETPKPKVEPDPGTTPKPKVEQDPGTKPLRKVERDPGTTPKPKVERDAGTTPKPNVEHDPGTVPVVKRDAGTTPFNVGGHTPSVFDIPGGSKAKSKKGKPVNPVKDKPKPVKVKQAKAESGDAASNKRKALIVCAVGLGIVAVTLLIKLLGGDNNQTGGVTPVEPTQDTIAEVVDTVAVIDAVDSMPTITPPVVEEKPVETKPEDKTAQASQSNQPEKVDEQKPAEPVGPTPAQLMAQEFNRAMNLTDNAAKQKALMALANKKYAPAYAPLAKVSLVLYDDDSADKYARLAISAGHADEVRAVVNALASQGYYDDPSHGKKPL